MRLSRTNFSNGFDNTGDQPADPESHLGKAEPQRRIYGAPAGVKSDEGPFEADTDAMAEIEGRGDAPVWQSAFVLGPNVRFTRTPESVYSKRPVGDVKKEPEAPTPAPQVVFEEAEVAVEVPDDRPVIEPVVEEPRAASGIQLLSLRLRQELETSLSEPAAAEFTGPADIDLVCFPAEQEIVAVEVPETAIRQASSFLHVSDEVFWNTLDMEADINALAPQAYWQPPEVHSPAGSVTALYREIGIKPSERRVVAPAVSRPAPIATPALAVEESRPVIAEVASPVEPVRIAKPQAAVSRPIRAVRPDTFVAIPEMTAEPGTGEYVFPPVTLLQEPSVQETAVITQEALEQSAGLLESVLEDFGVRGEIIDVRPGPVVTLYEFEPAPGVKSSRVIGLADDIARSMSALSARVAVVPGRNVIGIELPNPVRETVYFRELIEFGKLRGDTLQAGALPRQDHRW